MVTKNLVCWMAKKDPEAYGFWKNDLRLVLGRSIKKTEEAIRILKICVSSPDFGWNCKHSAIKKIARKMGKYQNFIGASITFNFLYNLARDHKRKILKRRNVELSK